MHCPEFCFCKYGNPMFALKSKNEKSYFVTHSRRNDFVTFKINPVTMWFFHSYPLATSCRPTIKKNLSLMIFAGRNNKLLPHNATDLKTRQRFQLILFKLQKIRRHEINETYKREISNSNLC